MHVQNKYGRRKSVLKSTFTSSRAFSFLLILFILFLFILPFPAASAPFSTTNQFSTENPLSPTTRYSTTVQDIASENISNSTKSSPSIVVLDGEDIYVQSGTYHTFYQGYRLHVKGASTEGKRVWLELSLENETLEDLIATEGNRLVYTKNSSEVLNLTVDTIYAGTDGVLVRFSPVYQYLDTQLPRPVESEDSTPMYPLSPSQPLENENNRAEGFGSSLSIMVFLGLVLITGLFKGKGEK